MNNIYLYLGIYLFILLVIVFFATRKEKKEEFLIAGRNRNWLTILFSKFAGSIGIGWFITYTAYAYEFGFDIYIVVLGFVFGYGLFAFYIAPKIYKIAKENKFYTQGDLVYYYTKDKLSKNITNIISSIIQFSWLIIGIVGGAKIIDNIGMLNYELSLIIIILVTFSYIYFGGYKVVLITDIFQSFIILFFLSFMVYILLNQVEIKEVLSIKTGNLSIASIFGFFFYGIFSFLALSDRYQLLYAAKDLKSVQKGIFLTFIPLMFTASLLLLIGLFIYSKNSNLDPGLVFFETMKSYLPSTLLPLGLVLFFAGLSSSSDTYSYAISSHLSPFFKTKSKISSIRIVVILLMFLTLFVTYFFRDVVDLTVIAAGLSLTMSIPILYIISGGKDSRRFLNSILGSVIGFILGIILLGFKPSVALIVIISGVISLIKLKK